MLDELNRVKRKNERLAKENAELKQIIKDMREQLSYYNNRIKLLDEKEKRYNEMLSYVRKQQLEFERMLTDVKTLRNNIKKNT